ncbi:hypothetical protein CHH62_04740 [Niallia circulans]|nr:hypothetical protein CHH62_04740 [Niallia circulans]
MHYVILVIAVYFSRVSTKLLRFLNGHYFILNQELIYPIITFDEIVDRKSFYLLQLVLKTENHMKPA